MKEPRPPDGEDINDAELGGTGEDGMGAPSLIEDDEGEDYLDKDDDDSTDDEVINELWKEQCNGEEKGVLQSKMKKKGKGGTEANQGH